MKQYWVITGMSNGTLFNTFHKGTIAQFITKHIGKSIVVMNAFPCSKKDYEKYHRLKDEPKVIQK